jgi:acyl-CoA synthetase (AMP-forming)/AMP-acid ligase II/acyl carrier protein
MHAQPTPLAFEKLDDEKTVTDVTLVDLVQRWAKQRPTHLAYVYASERSEQAVTHAELDRRARAIGHVLAARYAPGTRALLLYPLGLDFVAAFFGCLYAGVIAVPLHPGRGKAATSRFAAALRDCGARLALTTSTVAKESFAAMSPEREFDVLVSDALATECEAAEPRTLFAATPDTIAFLQYTSGSTTEPKGTVVRHRNIMTNLAMIEAAFGVNASSVIVSWLPIFHDMGLIGTVLLSAYLGATAVLVSTLGFIKSPILWLRAIQRYRADLSGGPNFGYDLCVDKTTPEERAGLDLSSWRAAFNGAEPVRERTLERFAAAFAPFGFKKTALAPTYGLAETTLMVSGGTGQLPHYLSLDAQSLKDHRIVPARKEQLAKILVGNGRCDFGDQVVAIVDPDSQTRCSDSQIGEIWVSGGHVASGYWQNERATERTFGARLGGDSRRYLRTGDLGFLRDKVLFVTGRLKDLIIFRGQNLYPQDIELTLELALPELRQGSTAAFASDDDTTGITVVGEIEHGEVPSGERLARAARQLRESHEVPFHRLVLARRNTVPKTTSGKIQRQRCKTEYERGDYAVLAEWTSEVGESPVAFARQLRAYAVEWILRERGVSPESIEGTAPLASYGIDSIRKIAFVSSLELRFRIVVPESSFFAIDTLDDLVRLTTAGRTQTSPEIARERAAPAPCAGGQAPKPVLPVFSSMSWETEDD